MRPHAWLFVVIIGAILGLGLAASSTYDFVQHLDRQVHSLNCSVIPGIGKSEVGSGCQVAMMSQYSSVFRSTVWGGVPISLPAMSVFAFILFFAVDLTVTQRKDDPRATAFLAAATCLPALASIVMGYISLTKLGTVCQVCLGMYIASAACLLGGVFTWRRAVALEHDEALGAAKAGQARLLEVEVKAPPASTQLLATAFGIGVVFVAVPIALYLMLAPDHSRFIGSCGGLAEPKDVYGVMVKVGPNNPGGAPAIEVLDPMCPACKAFEQRLSGAKMVNRLDRRAVLFPLDTTCNWMVTESTHPGACTISEAVLCAGDKSDQVIQWAFANQERVKAAMAGDQQAAQKLVTAQFPELAQCVGSPEAKSRVNKSLRWAVTNNITVLTPQLYVGGVKLCDEDVDLGLDYSLDIMLSRHARGALAAAPGTVQPPASTALTPEPGEVVPPPVVTPPPGGEPTAGTEPATGDQPPAGDQPPSTGSGTAPTGTQPAGSAGTQPPPSGTQPPPSGTDKPPAGDQPPSGTDKPPAGDQPPPSGTDKPPADKPADKPPADKPADKPPSEPAPPPADPAPGGTQ